MIHSDDVERLLIEVTLKKPPAVEDTPELAELRETLERECAEIIAKGGTVLIPHEIP